MSTKQTNATKRKLAAKKKAAKTMAPMPASKLAAINEQRVKQGLAPMTAEEANQGTGKPAKGKGKPAKKPKAAKPAKPAKIVPVIREITPSTIPVQDLFKDRVVRRESGLIEVSKDITAGEAVSLVAFFADAQKSAGMHIGAIIVAAEKNKSATLDEIAKATGLERKTLHNMASTMRNTSIATIERAMKKGLKNKHDVTYTHVAAVAALEPDKKTLLLDRVAEEGLTVAALNIEVRKLAPKTAKRQKAAEKKAEKERKAKEAREAAALAAGTPSASGGAGAGDGAPAGDGGAAGGVIVVDAPLSEDDEKAVEEAENHLDALVTFLRGKLWALVGKKRKVQFVKPLRQVAEAHEALLVELENIAGVSK